MTSRRFFLALLPLAVACEPEVTIDDSDCELVTWRLHCERGFLTAEDGCEICECAPS